MAHVLRQQGALREASRFRAREHRLQRHLQRYERRWFAWAFSHLLDFVAGYGELPERTVGIYVVVVLGFAGIYTYIGGALGPHLTLLQYLIFSVVSFHGRGFFPGPHGIHLDNPITLLAAVEAVVGLFIELTFIASFTRRFLGT